MHRDMEHFIHSVIIDLPISDVKLMELRELNCNDPTMQMLQRYAMEGWPEHKRDVPLSLKPFWNVRNDIQVTDGILLTGLSFHLHGEKIYFRNCIQVTVALKKPKLMRVQRYFGLA